MAIASASTCDAAQAEADDPVVAIHEQTGGTLENHPIKAEWHLRDGHLAGLLVQNEAGSQSSGTQSSEEDSIQLVQPFSIELKDFGVLRAADLPIQGLAKVEHLTAAPDASRYSDRLPGIAVHYELTDTSKRFHADWALVLRRDSRYIRQILTITAEDKPLPLNDISMIDVHRTGTVVAGTVKGSPLIS